MQSHESFIEEMCENAKDEEGIAHVLYAAKNAEVIDKEAHRRLSYKFGITANYFI
jgi:hypothetical protein